MAENIMPRLSIADRAREEREYLTQGRRRTLINSLSGGVDSTVSAAISREATKEGTLALLLPCSTEPERQSDVVDGQRVADHLGIPAVTVNLTDLWQEAVALLTAKAREMAALSGQALDEGKLNWAVNNLKPTLRMMTGGFFADAFEGLMMGTDNAIENFLGYFSIRGDGVADRQPIRDCTKAEVRGLAAAAGYPEDLVMRTPTAGLWPGQTDEAELGFSYDQADALFLWLLERHREQTVFSTDLTVLPAAAERLFGQPGGAGALPVPLEVAKRIVAQNQRTAFKRKGDDLARLLERRGLTPDTHVPMVSIHVSDVPGLLPWYQHKLGLRIRYQEAYYAEFDTGGAVLALDGGGVHSNMPKGFEECPIRIHLKTDDIEGRVAELRAQGVTVGDIEAFPYGKFATLHDPEGNPLVLWQTAGCGATV